MISCSSHNSTLKKKKHFKHKKERKKKKNAALVFSLYFLTRYFLSTAEAPLFLFLKGVVRKLHHCRFACFFFFSPPRFLLLWCDVV